MRKIPWLIFGLVFAWKILLLVFSAQPVPANDAFFYDGAIIHYLTHGGFYNPTVALGFPISGSVVFSAYPPLYQLPLLGWMSLFGTSALAAMALHLVLFGAYLLILFAILGRLQVPAWCINVAGFFLLTFTFHDRPDSFAHFLGILALYCAIRSRRFFQENKKMPSCSWIWLAAMLILLAFATSLQIGAFYLGVIFLLAVGASFFAEERFPWLPLALMAMVPLIIVMAIPRFYPAAWAGFLENVHQTPFLSGFRKPAVSEILKIVRTVPGILMATALFFLAWGKGRLQGMSEPHKRQFTILLAALIPAWGIILGSLTVISANTVAVANYLQPIIVAGFLALIAEGNFRFVRRQVVFLIPCIILGSVRAIGMTTWGLVCANDVSYGDSRRLVNEELARAYPNEKVVMSSAFLYGAITNTNVVLIHSDWLEPLTRGIAMSDDRALLSVRPGKIIVTQFDFYRRYQGVLANAENNPSLKKIAIKNCAAIRSPDSYKSWQQVVQQISWAPVIINLSWEKNP